MGVVLTATHRRRSVGWQRGLRADLAALDRLIGAVDVPVYLVGGLGLAVRAGAFYRNHRDLDIAVFLDDIAAFAHHLQQRGVAIVQQRLGGYLTPWHRIQWTAPTDWERVRRDPDSAHLRIVHGLAGKFAAAERHQYVDVFLLGRTGRYVELYGYDRRVPMDEFFPCRPAPGCTNLRLPRPSYKAYLPPTNDRQAQDLARAGLRPRGAAEPRQLR